MYQLAIYIYMRYGSIITPNVPEVMFLLESYVLDIYNEVIYGIQYYLFLSLDSIYIYNLQCVQNNYYS